MKKVSIFLKVMVGALVATFGGLSVGTVVYSTNNYNQLNSQYEQQQEQYNKQKEKNELLTKNYRQVQEQKTQLQALYNQLQQDYETLEAENQGLETNNSSLTAENDNKDLKISNLEAQLEILKADYESLEDSYEALILELSNEIYNNTLLETEYNKLESQFTALQTSFANLQTEYNALYNEMYPPKVATEGEVKKLVMFIGDGMSLDHIACTENYLEEGDTLNMKELSFSGAVDTKSLNVIEYSSATPDSAAGATALATGTRVYNGYISMDKDGNELTSISEVAHALGLGVGIITTDLLYEATPAAFSAHTSSRYNFVDIRADQYASRFDLFLGADAYGEKLVADENGFYSADNTLVDGEGTSGYIYELEKAKIESAGYKFVNDIGYNVLVLENLIENDKIFGAFQTISKSYLEAPQYNSKVNSAPSLSQLTEFALEWMELHFPNGYFLMIEHNEIDVNSELHNNSDIRYNTGDMVECVLELDRCVGIARRTLDKEGDNYAIVVSADHATGSLTESQEREGNYGFWSSWHDNDDVPYYIEAGACDLEDRVDNIKLFDFMESILPKPQDEE